MALSGVHVTCAYVGGPAFQGTFRAALLGQPQWSQTMASAGTTDSSAAGTTDFGQPCFEVRSSADIYVAIGANPNAGATSGSGASTRIFIPANETRNILCSSGDKLAWVAA